ncbi:hypothetical protein GOP47_0024096 [Adiantum capillus-veneris]|uniref:Uncharacterized protein n=1 Tax=Adiantum capillus-veneris TaxID=13818 RepID=A0A9D4U792_ADICA|nr:hypothetical protein GOP47_0024096 [Adiantum capillus-veneris]
MLFNPHLAALHFAALAPVGLQPAWLTTTHGPHKPYNLLPTFLLLHQALPLHLFSISCRARPSWPFSNLYATDGPPCSPHWPSTVMTPLPLGPRAPLQPEGSRTLRSTISFLAAMLPI